MPSRSIAVSVGLNSSMNSPLLPPSAGLYIISLITREFAETVGTVNIASFRALQVSSLRFRLLTTVNPLRATGLL